MFKCNRESYENEHVGQASTIAIPQETANSWQNTGNFVGQFLS